MKEQMTAASQSEYRTKRRAGRDFYEEAPFEDFEPSDYEIE